VYTFYRIVEKYICITTKEANKGLFVVGDCASGASLVVRAIAHSRSVAKDIDNYLCF
jgi:NADPH-dependent glutamate synthase beta subunit-like oxidoreductase